MRVVLALSLLLTIVGALASSGPFSSHHSLSAVHASKTFAKFRSLGAAERRALTSSGFNLGDCGPLCELDLPGIIAYNGYPVETHTLPSLDGQLNLNVYRIRCGRNFSECSGPQRPAVLLQHGLLDSGTTWITNPTDESLAYILADAGYDVWIGNSRGNTYSPCQTDACWKFSYDEMALYDLPTVIGHIVNTTGLPTITYIGHSQGTTQAFASFSTLPDVAAKINLFVALAPAVFVHNQQSPLLTLLVDFDIDKLFQLFGLKEFLPSDWFLKLVASLFCDGGIFTPICEDVIFSLCGDDPSKNHDMNTSRVEVYLTHTPAGTSVQNMAHWAQAVRQNQFQMYDYGTQGNMDHYGQATPPLYNLTNLAVPTALFSGGHDYLADPTDVEQLMTVLPANVQVFKQYIEDYSHLDFVWGVDAATRVYPNVLKLLQQYAVPQRAN